MENKKFYQLKNKNILENSPDNRISHNNNLRLLQDEMEKNERKTISM